MFKEQKKERERRRSDSDIDGPKFGGRERKRKEEGMQKNCLRDLGH